MFKKCTGCGIEKPFEDFGKDKKGKFGLNQKCKICCRKRDKNKNRSKESIEKNKLYKAEWQKEKRVLLNERLRERYKNNLEESRLLARERTKRFRQTDKWKKLKKHYDQVYERENKEKIRAQSKVRCAIYRKKLVRPSVCDICHSVCKVHAHHNDYSKPFEIVWMCPTCHLYHHQKHRFHRDRLSERTPKGDAKVRPCEETTRGRFEEVSPPIE